MQFNKEFSEQKKSLKQNFLKPSASNFQPKDDQSLAPHSPLKNQKRLRKIWSLNLLKALSSGVVQQHSTSISKD